MISMKRDPQAKPGSEADCCGPEECDKPAYPWGLQINLESDELDKLGLKQLPAVETVVRITAVATVTSVSETQEQGGDKRRCVTLQITDMDPPKPRNAMYPNSDMNP